MSHRNINLHNWLLNEKDCSSGAKKRNYSEYSQSFQDISQNKVANSDEISEPAQGFNPIKFLSNSCADIIQSKKTRTLTKLMEILQTDLRNQFFKEQNFTKSFKIALYTNFMAFSECQNLNFSNIESYNALWACIHDPNLKKQHEIDQFLQIFFNRIIFFYIIKLRFVLLYIRETNQGLKKRYLLNPTSYILEMFKRSSSNEIKSEAFKSNQYTWFYPSSEIENDLNKACLILPDLTEEELALFLTSKTLFSSPNTESFSSFSDKNTAHFLHTLILNLPQWVTQTDSPQIICKYSGDQIQNLSQSYWKSIDYISETKGAANFFPFIYPEEPFNQDFVSFCNEILYCSNLIKSAPQSDKDLLKYISHSFNQNFNLLYPHQEKQINLFDDNNNLNRPNFNKIILNINEFPKNNPHFFLISRIVRELENLSSNGFLFVISSKKLFVPSLSDKVEQLLNKLTLIANINLEHLKGRGDIAPYIYVFNKKKKVAPNNSVNLIYPESEADREQDESCFTFRITGEVLGFSQFEVINKNILNFLINKRAESTSVFQTEINGQLNIEIYQDAVVDGKLINSTKDSNHITHPAFFRKLLKTSLPLEFFISLQQIFNDKEETETIYNNGLGIGLDNEKKYQSILMLDMRIPNQYKIDIFPSTSFRGKSQENGFALCQYFGIMPKVQNLNLNLLKYFFDSLLGQQIIQFTITGGLRKIKSKLSSLLIPKFVGNAPSMPTNLLDQFSFLMVNADKLVDIDIGQFKDRIHSINSVLEEVSFKYPKEILVLIGYLKNQIAIALESCSESKKSEQVVPDLSKLERLTVLNIYPNNPDAYIDFLGTNEQTLANPLEKTNIHRVEDGQSYIELISKKTIIIKIYSDIDILNFIQFILNSATNYPIKTLLLKLKIPKINDYKSILIDTKKVRSLLHDLNNFLTNLINKILMGQYSV